MSQGFTEIKKESGGVTPLTDSDARYPYGTSLSFENDMVDSLGIGALSVGDVVEVRGVAVVDRKSEHEDDNGVDKSMCIQLTKLRVDRRANDAATELYGGDPSPQK